MAPNGGTMPRQRDETSGKYVERYPAEDFEHALAEGGPAGTGEVADRVGCDRRTAYLKLNSLQDEGRVSSRKIGQALLWVSADE